METVIGLLMVLLPVIFKLIGKRLEQAGQGQQNAGPVEETPIEDWAETVRKHLEQISEQEEPYVESEPVMQEAAQKVVHEPVAKKVRKHKPILQEDVKKKREKIDTRKLIVYSEIMKPKYTE